MKEKYNFLGSISSYFIKKYRVVYLLLIMIVLAGVMAYNELPREERPEVTMESVRIITTYTGISPSEMESLVTDVIEEGVEDIDGVDEITSTTSLGQSMVFVTFEEDWDMDEAVADVESALLQVDLPEDADDPEAGYMNSTDIPIMTITLSGEFTLMDLKTFGESLQDEISNVTGVSEVELRGGLDKIIEVSIDRQKLDMYGLTMSDVSTTLKSANSDNPIGSADLDTMDYTVRMIGQFDSLEDIEEVIVTDVNGYPVYLKDIAEVAVGEDEASSIAERYDSEVQDKEIMVPTVSLSVQRDADADVIQASADIRTILEEGEGSLYPETLNVAITNEDAVNVNEALDDVIGNAISGLLLVIVVLFIFIGFKESIIVAFVIPLSLLISFVCMEAYGVTLNTMSMVALILALGMLVDNAIVIMENIDRIRDEGHEITEASSIATNQVAPAVFAATLTTMSAFIPIAFAGGMLGQIMSVIPVVVIFAIGASFLISIIVTPTLCSRLLSKKKVDKKLPFVVRLLSIVLVGVLSAYAFEGSIVMWYATGLFSVAMFYKMFLAERFRKGGEKGGIIELYGKTLRRILSRKVYAVIGLAICLGIFYLSINTIVSGRLKIELMPDQDSTTLTVSATMPEGYLLEDSVAIAEQVEDKLFDYPEVLNIVSNVQESSVSHTIEIVSEEERDMSSLELISSIREDVSSIAGVEFTVGQTTRGFRGSDYPVTVEIIGDDSVTVEAVSEDLVEMLKMVDGATEVSSSLVGGPPELNVYVDQDKLTQYGISEASVASVIKENMVSTVATSIVLDGEEMDIELLYEDSQFDSVSDFNSITFTSKDGTTIYFDQIASVVETKGLTSITHQDLQRIESVTSQVEDDYTATEVLESFEKMLDNYNTPKNITINIAGEREDITETFTDLVISMGWAILLVFIILAVQFNSLSQPLVILFTIPLATIGAIWGLIITGNNFSTYAFFGIVSLVGIAVNDAIVLIDYFNYLRLEEGMSLVDAIVEGGKTRFIPVFSTTITTIGGILPLALKDAEYAQLGYSLIFGLMVATLLTLVVIPMIYLMFESSKTVVRKYVPIMVDER